MIARMTAAMAVAGLMAMSTHAQAPRAGSGALVPEGRIAPPAHHAQARVPQPLAVGTVQYDPGPPADAFLTGPPVGLEWFGNLFNSNSGQPLQTGTATGITWYQGAVPSIGVAFGFASAGGAGIGPVVYPPLPAANTFNAASVSQPVPASFIAVQIGRSPGASWGSVAMRSATTNAQGFHGRVIPLFSAVTSVLSGQNAMIRVSGNVLIPVELLEFEVD